MSNKYIIKYPTIICLFLLVLPQLACANEINTTDVPFNKMTWILGNTFLVVGGLVALAGLGAIFNLANKLLEIQKIRLLQEHGIEVMEKAGLTVDKKEPFWASWNKKAWKLVPIEKEKDIMLDHNYDGIKELDNVLPPWWVNMFYATIVFAFGYITYYHIMDTDWSSKKEWEQEVAMAEQEVKAYLAAQSDRVDETNAEMLVDANELSLGETVYQNSCAACHGKLGEGGVGPNFTDEYWLHGGDIKDVFRTIKYGVPEKGMISWKAQLTPANIHRVASYIMTLKGTNPPNPKAPQGEIYKGNETSQDSTANEKIGMK